MIWRLSDLIGFYMFVTGGCFGLVWQIEAGEIKAARERWRWR